MSTPTLHAWKAYVSACDANATPKQRQRLFDAWWKLEWADVQQAFEADQRASRKKKARALSVR